MAWYSARLAFECFVGGRPVKGPRSYPFEERLVLFTGTSLNEVKQRARQYGVRSQHSYENAYGQTVSWKFVGVLDVMETVDPRPTNGAEIYSRFVSRSALKLVAKGRAARPDNFP